MRNAAESAAQQGREFAGKAYHSVSEKVGDRVPDSVADRVRSLRERNGNGRQRTTGAPATPEAAPHRGHPRTGARRYGQTPPRRVRQNSAPWG